MTEPMIVKAMDHLDDDLIAAAAERKAAPRLMTKKKFVALLAACLLLVGTFAMMGMETEPAGPTKADREAAWLAYMDYLMKEYPYDPEMQAYCAKWIEIGFDALDPWPDEWQYPDGSFKDFVTIEMIVDVYEGSLLQEYDLSDPEYAGQNVTVGGFCFSDGGPGLKGKSLCYGVSYLVG